jgi:uncharacterized repeat protein (TIGR02543 family)
MKNDNINKSNLYMMNITRTTLILLFSFILFTASSPTAQTVTVNPKEYKPGLNNPYKGFRQGIFRSESGFGKWKNPEYNTIWRHYIAWSDIESNADDGVQKIIDFCNKTWKGAEAANVRIIPRVYIDWDKNSGNEYWPADILTLTGLKADDPKLWAHPVVKDRIVKLIEKLGQAWDNDERVAWVQTGILGYWGEQESPVGVHQDGWAKRLGDAYAAAFKNKKLVVRNQPDWDALGYKWGVYWDSYGHPGQRNGAWSKIQNTNATGRYLSEIIEGEVAYDWGTETFDPMYGGEPELTLNKTKYTNNMIDVIRELHCSGLGWISSYMAVNPEYKDIVSIDSLNANASIMQNEFGYRFLLSEFTSQTRTEPGSKLDFSFKVKNTASAPFYYKWPVAVVLIDETTRQIKEKIIIPDIDITKWLPGDKYSYTTRTYQTPAVTHTISGSVTIPGSLPKGNYLVGISILEPNSKSPGIFFAVENFFKESQTQPLARIGIGEDAGANTLDGVRFDNPKTNDTRYYSISPTEQTYSITITTPVNGSINIPDGPYPANSNIIVTAIPDSGYIFSSWGGDLTGSPNPAILSMDSNKKISVNFKPVGSKTNLFINGDFSTSELIGWSLNTVSPSTATASVINEEGVVDITNDDGMHWHISLMQYNITLINGVRYTLKFKAKAQANRTISTKVQLNNDPWTSYQDSVVSITTIMNSYSVTWVQTETNSNSKVGFFVGAQGLNNVWFDDVELYADGPAAKFSFTTSAANGNVTLNPAGGTYDAGTTVIATATPDAGYKFTGWSGDLSGTTSPVSVLMDKNMNVTANFALITYTLSASASNGDIAMNPAVGAYIPGTVVTLTATPKTGYVFNGWSGDLTGSANPATITMDKNKSVTANFKAINYTLATSATNGSVSLSPIGGSYISGTQVTLTAKPNSGYVFVDWTGDLTGSENPATITMDKNKSVTANFKRITYTLTANAVNGSINLEPDGGGTYNSGAFVYITATPDSGYVFNGWNGDQTGEQNPALITMNQNKNITALFKQIISTANANELLPAQTMLGKIYPNPFSTVTTIPFEIKEASHIRISILNLSGQEVCTLINKQLSPGKYTIHWNGSDKSGNRVTEGIYFCQMESDSHAIQVGKIIFNPIF